MNEPETLVAHQIELEKTFSKNQLLPRIKAEFQQDTTFTDHITLKGIPVPFGLDLMAQMALHKRASLETLIGLLWHHFKDAQLTADMLLKAAYADLLIYNMEKRLFMVIFELTAEVQAELDRFQFPLPMVVEPREITNNRETGYYLGGGSVILKDNHHEDDVCLDHLNRLNKVRFTINEDVARYVKNKWRNLDKCKPGEDWSEYQERKAAFERYDRTAKDVMKLLMQESDSFHLTHRYDKRGRTYACGYHLTYQGNAWNKAVIEFYDKEVVE